MFKEIEADLYWTGEMSHVGDLPGESCNISEDRLSTRCWRQLAAEDTLFYVNISCPGQNQSSLLCRRTYKHGTWISPDAAHEDS